jgi:2'-5' RNA ligase
MPRRRLGVVLVVPPPVGTEIDGLRRACGSESLGRIPPHLTLVPPVNVREDDLAAGSELLRGAASQIRPFDLELGPPATFHPATPVVYLAVGGSETAQRTLYGLRDAVFRPPFERELTYDFHPHVTLAEDLPAERIASVLDGLADFRAHVTFERVHLLEELRRDDGVRTWEPIDEAPFSQRAVVGRGGLETELTTTEAVPHEAAAFEGVEWPIAGRRRFGPDVGAPTTLVVTARRDGAVVGVASGWTEGGLATLESLIVGAENRGEGIGSQLLARFEADARARQSSVLTLQTAVDEPESFYLERGWHREALLADYQYGRDRVVLRRDL